LNFFYNFILNIGIYIFFKFFFYVFICIVSISWECWDGANQNGIIINWLKVA